MSGFFLSLFFGSLGSLQKNLTIFTTMENELIQYLLMQKNGGALYNQRNSIAPKYWNQYGIKY